MHPHLRTPFGDLPTYTLCVALGFFSAALLTWIRHRRRGFHFETVATLGIAAALTGIAGARMWYVATHPQIYAPWFASFPRGGMNPTAGWLAGAACAGLLLLYARPALRPHGRLGAPLIVVSLSTIAGMFAARIAALHASFPASDPFSPGGGLAFFGGLAAAGTACLVIAARRGIPPSAAADALAPGLLVGTAIGRIGCFLNGCCAGNPAHGPLAPGDRIPTQLIEAVLTASLGILLIVRPPSEGRIAAIAALGYAAARFTLDFFRSDVSPVALGLTPSQLAALLLAILAAGSLLRSPAPRPA